MHYGPRSNAHWSVFRTREGTGRLAVTLKPEQSECMKYLYKRKHIFLWLPTYIPALETASWFTSYSFFDKHNNYVMNIQLRLTY